MPTTKVKVVAHNVTGLQAVTFVAIGEGVSVDDAFDYTLANTPTETAGNVIYSYVDPQYLPDRVRLTPFAPEVEFVIEFETPVFNVIAFNAGFDVIGFGACDNWDYYVTQVGDWNEEGIYSEENNGIIYPPGTFKDENGAFDSFINCPFSAYSEFDPDFEVEFFVQDGGLWLHHGTFQNGVYTLAGSGGITRFWASRVNCEEA